MNPILLLLILSFGCVNHHRDGTTTIKVTDSVSVSPWDPVPFGPVPPRPDPNYNPSGCKYCW